MGRQALQDELRARGVDLGGALFTHFSGCMLLLPLLLLLPLPPLLLLACAAAGSSRCHCWPVLLPTRCAQLERPASNPALARAGTQTGTLRSVLLRLVKAEEGHDAPQPSQPLTARQASPPPKPPWCAAPQHGLHSDTMAQITSDFDAMRCDVLKWL